MVKMQVALKQSKYSYLKVFLIACIASGFIFLPSIIINGGVFMYMGDYNAQQIPFFVHCHDVVRSGNFAWDFGTELGTDFFSSYTYYTVTSPFFWLTVPFPSSWVPYLMGPIFMLKFGLSALTAYLFIRKYVKTSKAAAFGSLLYAFSGWSTYNIFYFQFHESLIVFPLILLGLDKLVEERKFGYFSLAVAVAAIVNYYFFVGIVVFTVIYWAVRTLRKSWNMNFRTFLWITGEGFLGVLLASFVLLPSAFAVFGMSRTDSMLSFGDWFYYKSFEMYACIFQSLFFPPDIPAFQSGVSCKTVAWQSLSMYLPFIGPIATFTFIKNNKKHWISDLIKISIVMMFIPVLNTLFTLLQPVYYARWFMMPLLIMSLASARASEEIKVKDFKEPALATFIITTAYSIMIILLNALGMLKGGNLELFLVLLGFVLFSFALLYNTYRNSKNKYPILAKRLIPLILVFAVSISSLSILYGYSSSQEGKDISFIKQVNSDIKTINKNNDRVSALTSYNNIFMYGNTPTIDCFHSVVDGNTSDFYKSVLNRERTVYAPSVINMASYKSFLSVKYFVVDYSELKYYLDFDFKTNYADEKTTELIKQIRAAYKKYGNALHPGFKSVIKRDNYEIFENECYLPFGIPYYSYILQEDYDKLTVEQKNEALIKAVIVKDKPEGLNLQRFEPSKSFTDSDYILYCKKLKEQCGKNFKYGSDIKFSITSKTDGLVLISTPANKDWSAYVNNTKSEIIKVDGGLMALKIKTGSNNICLTYKNQSLKYGFAISGFAFLVFVSLFVVNRLFFIRRKTEKDLEYVFGA